MILARRSKQPLWHGSSVSSSLSRDASLGPLRSSPPLHRAVSRVPNVVGVAVLEVLAKRLVITAWARLCCPKIGRYISRTGRKAVKSWSNQCQEVVGTVFGSAGPGITEPKGWIIKQHELETNARSSSTSAFRAAMRKSELSGCETWD